MDEEVKDSRRNVRVVTRLDRNGEEWRDGREVMPRHGGTVKDGGMDVRVGTRHRGLCEERRDGREGRDNRHGEIKW